MDDQVRLFRAIRRSRTQSACNLAVVSVLMTLAVPVAADTLELDQIRSGEIDPATSLHVESLMLEIPEARFYVTDGVLIPVTPINGEQYEFIFLGEGQFLFEPLDDIERQQLELFTGEQHLDTVVDEAVLVLASRAAVEHIFESGRPIDPDTAQLERAGEIYVQWKEGGGRHSLAVEAALLRLAWADKTYAAYFAGWFQGADRDDFYYLVEPDAREQIKLGRFETIEASDKELRKLEKQIGKQQRRGRLIGLEVEHLGRFDTWCAVTIGDTPPVSPQIEHYDIELNVEADSETISATIESRVRGGSYTASVLRLEIDSDLRVDAVAINGEGTAFHQHRTEIIVQLPVALPPDETVQLEISYSGRAFEEFGSRVVLRNTTGWYPQTPGWRPASFDVTLRWPTKLELVASGRRVQGGAEGNRQWERRILETPSAVFGFELGRYDFERTTVGEVRLALATDSASRRTAGENAEELLPAAAEAIEYFQELFGPPPHLDITLVTAPRGFSQSLPGLITISTSQISDSWIRDLFETIDPRVLVAHEIAHQWWGHAVMWDSYRDQWISEAMANYAAGLYAKHRLRESDLRPTGEWKSDLERTSAAGRDLESIGPVVLGWRLASSKSVSAYRNIVYNKGAVVFDMLARTYGEETFLQILRAIVDAVRFRPVSTSEFLRLVERLTDTDTQEFADQFVFGTGMPDILYEYEVAPQGDQWRLSASLEQRPSYRFEYAFERLPDGGNWDFRRMGVEATNQESFSLVVPVQIAVYDPSFEESRLKGRDRRKEVSAEERGNRVLQYHIAVRAGAMPIELDLPFEPKQFWLDAGAWVLGSYHNANFEPKRVLAIRARDAVGMGDLETALTLSGQALEADYQSGPTLVRSPEEDGVDVAARFLDSEIHFNRSRILLDLGRGEEARRAWKDGEQALELANRDRAFKRGLSATAIAQRGRLRLRDGEVEKAYRALEKSVHDDHQKGIEVRGVLALAALERGDLELLEEELDALDRMEVDTEPLRQTAGLGD